MMDIFDRRDQQLQLQQMQIRINLDQIFGGTHNENETQSILTSHQVSDKVSQSTSNNRYRINIPIFDDDDKQQTPKQTKTPKDTRQSPKSKSPSVVSIQTQFSDKAPGERLYYESKNTMSRKALELERLKLEKLKQEEKQTTFKPKINKNSQKILIKKGKQPVYEKKQSIKATPTHIRKQQQQILQCTFKPQLISKPTPGIAKIRPKNQIFQDLFNDHKLKQVKQKLKTQETEKQPKKLSKAEFQNFLARSNQFMSKVQKKKQIILTTSSRFDLDTGHKMFSPKTNTFKSHKSYFSKQSEPKQTSPAIVTKSIFAKNYENEQNTENPASIFNKNKNKNSESPSERQNFNYFEQIKEVKQDEQQQQIGQEQEIFRTVQCFQLNDNQDEIQQQQIPSIQNFRSKVNLANYEYYEDDPVEESHQYFGSEHQQKNSDEGLTHHEGEESRCREHE